MRKFARGFTLIELVIVMVILGVLAAFLLPRFASLDQRARVAAVSGLEGNIRAAAAIVHSQSLAEGSGSNSTGTTVLEGKTIQLIYGYPSNIGTPSGIEDALSTIKGFTASGSAPVLFSKDGAPDPANCSVSYFPATSTEPPTISANTTGC